MSRLANGAEAVLAARKKGLKPNEMLIVSLVGKVNEANHTIYANPASEYDWRWMRGLDVCIYANQQTNWQPVLASIAKCFPHWLGLYDVDRFKGATASYLPRPEDVDKPQAMWRWKLDFLPWMQFQNEEFAWGE